VLARKLCRIRHSELQRSEVQREQDVSEEYIASSFRVEEYAMQNQNRIFLCSSLGLPPASCLTDSSSLRTEAMFLRNVGLFHNYTALQPNHHQRQGVRGAIPTTQPHALMLNNLHITVVVDLAFGPPYPKGKRRRYPLKGRLGGPNSRFWRSGKEINPC
jgi:hypothetical protein